MRAEHWLRLCIPAGLSFVFYLLSAPLFPALRRQFSEHVTTTVNVGKPMIRVALSGYSKRILETHDIDMLVAGEQERDVSA